MTLYLSGPMSGLPDFNYPAFHAAADRLRTAGYHVINPAEHGVHPEWTYADYLRQDLLQLLTDADAVAVLPGWRTSRGTHLEVAVAHALSLPVASLTTWLYRATATSTLVLEGRPV
ncbi:DUF4406 domain-containing protein [Sulfobacillus thermosulfidooxidans]|uniref:DUF4406 domain-containing protein n=1 Tax=Sulfobacillus thermosulfidooxidans TaxID=28034 RepID=UPI0009E8F952|nr:DUF4406 domain-containing protein [Sulfobacillus thermosulfidooxidans]